MSTPHAIVPQGGRATNPAQAIRQKCLVCQNDEPEDVVACTVSDCPLYSYRLLIPEIVDDDSILPAKHPGGRPLLFNNCMDLEFFAMLFYGECWDQEKGEWKRPFTMSGLAVALGVDRKTLTNYAHRDEFFPTIRKLRAMVEQHGHEALYGRGHSTGAMFDLRVNHGWREDMQATVIHDHRHSIRGPMDAARLRELIESEAK